MVSLHGGGIQPLINQPAARYTVKNIDKLWSIVAEDPGAWNDRLSVLAEFEKRSESKDEIMISRSKLEAEIKNFESKEDDFLALMRQFSRKGIMTEDEAPVPEVVSYNDANYNAYPMAAATKFLVEELAGTVTVYDTDGNSSAFAAADFEAASVLIDDFQSGNSPILLAADGTAVEKFDYAAMESGEIIFSIVTEQEVNVNEYLQKFGWDNTKTYNLVATDVFYIPITPEDYDEGGLRGALSGAINANFPDMIIATGKLNDVVFIEEMVE